MPYRTTLKAVAVALYMSVILTANAAAAESDIAALWMAKSSGIWKLGDKYGYYKALVYREGVESPKEKLVILITQVNPKTNSQYIAKKMTLDSPGLKGNITDLTFNMINEGRMALSVDIEMKAMGGIVLREVYFLGPNGSVAKATEAKYLDVLE